MTRRAGPALPPTATIVLAVDRDIAGKGRRAGAVENGPAADDDIVHRACLQIILSYDRGSMRLAAPQHNARCRMTLMPGGGEAAANLADPGARAYLPGAAGEVASIPGALSLQADTDLNPEPYPPEGQGESGFHPSLPG